MVTRVNSAVPHANVLGVPISAIDMDDALGSIDRWIAARDRRYVCVCNVHTVMECQKSEATRQIYRNAGLVTPDGMPLVWVAHMMGLRETQRVYGPDLMLAAFERSASGGWRHLLYGGAEGVADELAERMRTRFPKIQIVDTISPPFRPLTTDEDADMMCRINRSGADIVWVGIGAPRQEHWMADHRDRLEAPVLIGVGAAFDFHAQTKPQAPRWMMNHGLEWLFRLGCEPRRLWRRYLVNNPLFMWMVLMQFCGLRRY